MIERRDPITGRTLPAPSLGKTCGTCGKPVANKLRFCGRECYSESRRGAKRDPERVFRKHGLSYAPEYRAWQQMRLRCADPKHAAFADYGGRGITVCARWLESPENFLADVGPKPSPRHEIDRKDNDRGYSCGKCDDCVARGETANCRWTTRKVNDRNRRNNHLVEHGGERLTLAEWSERSGVRADTIADRLVRGWTTERAIFAPARAWNRRALAEAAAS